MTIPRIASLAALLFAASACDVGTFGMTTGGDDGGMIDISVCKDRQATASILPAHTHMAANVVDAADPTNAGQSCVAANCHLTGALGTNAPAYQAGGTLFSDSAGTVVNAGAWIRVRAMSGQVVEVATDAGGNFWFEDPNVLPTPVNYQTAATFCGGTTAVDAVAAGVTKMVSPIASGNCNSSSCHGKVAGASNVLFLQ